MRLIADDAVRQDAFEIDEVHLPLAQLGLQVALIRRASWWLKTNFPIGQRPSNGRAGLFIELFWVLKSGRGLVLSAALE